MGVVNTLSAEARLDNGNLRRRRRLRAVHRSPQRLRQHRPRLAELAPRLGGLRAHAHHRALRGRRALGAGHGGAPPRAGDADRRRHVPAARARHLAVAAEGERDRARRPPPRRRDALDPGRALARGVRGRGEQRQHRHHLRQAAPRHGRRARRRVLRAVGNRRGERRPARALPAALGAAPRHPRLRPSRRAPRWSSPS